MSFIDDFEVLNTTDKNSFKEVVNNLLYQCFIPKLKYDRTTKIEKFNKDYGFIEKHFSLIEDYLSFMDVELCRDDTLGVCYVKSLIGKNHLRVDSTTTLLIYALRSYFEDKVKENPHQTKVFMNSTELRLYLQKLNLSTANKRISNQQLANSLRTLSNYNIVVREEGQFYDPYYSFYILFPIRLVIDSDRINTLYNKLTRQNQGYSEEDNQESFSEDEENVIA